MISGPLLLLLAVLLGTHVFEAGNSPSPPTCASIPYPFGISGKAMKGFEIRCSGSSPILQLRKYAYQIEDISLPHGYVSIYAGAITYGCSPNLTRGSGWMDLEGTPYTISTTKSSGNMLMIVGCNHMALLQGPPGTLSSACAASCNYNDGEVGGSCHPDMGCCQASIHKGLKSFNMMLGRIDPARGKDRVVPISEENTTCSRAFFAKQSGFTFSMDFLTDVVSNNQVSPDRYLMALDWAIGNETCEEAGRKVGTYACKENSYCYKSTGGMGYRCNCSQGYQGNPYVKDGCKGIPWSTFP